MDDISKYGFPSHCCDYEPGAPSPQVRSDTSQRARSSGTWLLKPKREGEPN